MTKSLRLRLTLWYLAFFSVLMVLFSMFLYSLLSRSVVSRLDERLSSEVNTAAKTQPACFSRGKQPSFDFTSN